MDSNTSSYMRGVSIKKLNENLCELGIMNKQLKDIKNKNEKLELDLQTEKENNKHYSKEYQNLCDQFNEIQNNNNKLNNELNNLDQNIKDIYKRVEEKNLN